MEHKEDTKKLKLIWDFRGPDALHIAKHHVVHLDEFIQINHLELQKTGFEQLSEMHSIAYMIVPQEKMIPVRDALKPNRGEYYND